MSFSSDLKQTIIDHKFKNACCRRSLLLGALSAKAHIDKENEISFNADGSNTIDYISDIIHAWIYCRHGHIWKSSVTSAIHIPQYCSLYRRRTRMPFGTNQQYCFGSKILECSDRKFHSQRRKIDFPL